jgi:hypothetical protein
MRKIVLIALTICACERQSQQVAQGPTSAVSNQLLTTGGKASKPAAVVPMPTDQAQLDRMILAGYTPHGKHLHPPGVNECPLAQGSDAVM